MHTHLREQNHIEYNVHIRQSYMDNRNDMPPLPNKKTEAYLNPYINP